jgi:cullin-associated NEDD8-dissociated protein 1
MEQIKISPLITEALTNPDPDIQYMKAEDLTTHLLNYYSQPPKGIVDENT